MHKKIFLSFLSLLVVIVALNAQEPLRLVISGGPGVGKSTVLNLLNQQGFAVIPETMGVCFYEAKQAGRLNEFFADTVRLQTLLMERQLQQEAQHDNEEIVFLDRSAYDITFYAEWFNVQMPDAFMAIAPTRPYHIVFFLEPLPEEFYQNSDLRTEPRKLSLGKHEFLRKKYEGTSLPVLSVPFDTPENRVRFILDNLTSYITMSRFCSVSYTSL